jgi:transcriptional regulator with XRE-family HTH domain
MKNDQQATLRRWLRDARARLGLTQRDVAAMLGMPLMTYHRLERGHRRIKPRESIEICRAFHRNPNDLFADPADAQTVQSQFPGTP